MARNEALQAISAQLRSSVPNIFSHTNKRYDSLMQSRTKDFQPCIDLDIGIADTSVNHMNCR